MSIGPTLSWQPYHSVDDSALDDGKRHDSGAGSRMCPD